MTLPILDPPRREPVVPAPRVFMIDNYDSFTYNLVQYLGELGADITVKRNDTVSLDEIAAAQPTHLVVSPGPCTPNEAGISMDAIARFGAEHLPVLGVCLGHQAIGHVYGGSVVRAPNLMHGKTSPIEHHQQGVFEGLPSPLTATRYHSLVIDPATMPDCLEVTATCDDIVMGVRHRTLPVEGVQFHPESILTGAGHDLLRNFLRRAGAPVHGKTDEIGHDGRGVFAGLPDPFTATRYHSLVVDEELPGALELTAWNAEGVVMGVRHRELPVHGVQFHPESVLTPVGLDLLRNFLRLGGSEGRDAACGPTGGPAEGGARAE